MAREDEKKKQQHNKNNNQSKNVKAGGTPCNDDNGEGEDTTPSSSVVTTQEEDPSSLILRTREEQLKHDRELAKARRDKRLRRDKEIQEEIETLKNENLELRRRNMEMSLELTQLLQNEMNSNMLTFASSVPTATGTVARGAPFSGGAPASMMTMDSSNASTLSQSNPGYYYTPNLLPTSLSPPGNQHSSYAAVHFLPTGLEQQVNAAAAASLPAESATINTLNPLAERTRNSARQQQQQEQMPSIGDSVVPPHLTNSTLGHFPDSGEDVQEVKVRSTFCHHNDSNQTSANTTRALSFSGTSRLHRDTGERNYQQDSSHGSNLLRDNLSTTTATNVASDGDDGEATNKLHPQEQEEINNASNEEGLGTRTDTHQEYNPLCTAANNDHVATTERSSTPPIVPANEHQDFAGGNASTNTARTRNTAPSEQDSSSRRTILSTPLPLRQQIVDAGSTSSSPSSPRIPPSSPLRRHISRSTDPSLLIVHTSGALLVAEDDDAEDVLNNDEVVPAGRNKKDL